MDVPRAGRVKVSLAYAEVRPSLDSAGERCAENRERGRGRGIDEREARMVPGLDKHPGAGGMYRVDGRPGPHDVRGGPSPEDDRLKEVSRSEYPGVDPGIPIGPLIGQDRERPSRSAQQGDACESSSPDQRHGISIVRAHADGIVRMAHGSRSAGVDLAGAERTRQRCGAEARKNLAPMHRKPGHGVFGVGLLVKRAVSTLIDILIARLSDV